MSVYAYRGVSLRRYAVRLSYPHGNGAVQDFSLYVLFNNVVRLPTPSSSHLMRGWAAYVLPPKTMICIIGYLCRSSLLNGCPTRLLLHEPARA